VRDNDQIPPGLSAVSLKSSKPFLVNNSKRQASGSTRHSRDKNLNGIMALGDRHNSLKLPSTSCKLK
jgi:hypothetical protein